MKNPFLLTHFLITLFYAFTFQAEDISFKKSFVDDSKVWFLLCYGIDHVGRDGLSEKAFASKLNTKLGYLSGSIYGFFVTIVKKNIFGKGTIQHNAENNEWREHQQLFDSHLLMHKLMSTAALSYFNTFKMNTKSGSTHSTCNREFNFHFLNRIVGNLKLGRLVRNNSLLDHEYTDDFLSGTPKIFNLLLAKNLIPETDHGITRCPKKSY